MPGMGRPRPSAGAPAGPFPRGCRRAGPDSRALRGADAGVVRAGRRPRTGVGVRPVRNGAARRRILRRRRAVLPQRAEAGARRNPLAVLPRAASTRAAATPTRRKPSYKRALALAPGRSRDAHLAGPAAPRSGPAGGRGAAVCEGIRLAPRTVAVLAGLGRVAVARRDYPQAVKYLEDALAIDPEAESLHAPLAAAYRGLGQLDNAQPHLRQWRNRDLPVPDPLQQDLDLLLESGLSYELRGVRAFEARDWPQAVQFFRKGIELTHDNTPLSRSLHHKLGHRALSDRRHPRREGAVRGGRPPRAARRPGRSHLQGTLQPGRPRWPRPARRSRPSSICWRRCSTSRTTSRRTWPSPTCCGAPAAPRPRWRTIAMRSPSTRARPSHASGTRWRSSSSGVTGRPATGWTNRCGCIGDRSDLKLALARLLSTSPDAAARDGARALTIGAADVRRRREVAHRLAKQSRWHWPNRATSLRRSNIQRDVIAAAQRAGMAAAAQRMTANLALYERHQPCRTPWIEDDLVSVPTSAVTAEAPLPASTVQSR